MFLSFRFNYLIRFHINFVINEIYRYRYDIFSILFYIRLIIKVKTYFII